MIRHSMDVIKLAVNSLNPNQVPVIAMDQPLFAVAKQIQWNWPDVYGERHFVIMFGDLHIEMGFLKVLGQWLDGTGWISALTEAKVASPGTAESFIKASNVVRTRNVHKVTASSLYILLHKAYDDYVKRSASTEDISFDDWCSTLTNSVPQFTFWYITFLLELLLLAFVRSIRQANFQLYVDTLSKMTPWFFALDHPNYARWLSIHIRDMCMLKDVNPEVHIEFQNGAFTINKTGNPFSSMAIDQAHEQNNAMVKDDGGAVGLTENPGALRRWMVSGPEISRMINEFEVSLELKRENDCYKAKHHGV